MATVYLTLCTGWRHRREFLQPGKLASCRDCCRKALGQPKMAGDLLCRRTPQSIDRFHVATYRCGKFGCQFQSGRERGRLMPYRQGREGCEDGGISCIGSRFDPVAPKGYTWAGDGIRRDNGSLPALVGSPWSGGLTDCHENYV